MGRPRRSLPELPHEIIFEEILPRLPARSLRRFKLVCKRWRELINDPYFIHSHLLYLNHQPSSTQQFSVLSTYKGKIYSRTIKSNSLSSIQVARKRLPPTKWLKPSKNMGPSFLGSCNGLIFLRTYHNELSLWNPCTGSYRALMYDSSPYHSFGFGYDAITKDFKLVGISRKLIAIAGAYDRVRVFTLNSNSWRPISSRPNHPTDLVGTGKFIDGVLYWVNFGEDILIHFDIHDEVFTEITLPDVAPEDKCDIEIIDTGGDLGLTRVLNHKLLEVWVMKGNWIKMYSVDVSSCGHRVRGLVALDGINFMRKNEKKDNHVDQVIYVGTCRFLNRRTFFSINPTDHRIIPYPLSGSSYLANCGSIITYVESLVSVDLEKKSLPN